MLIGVPLETDQALVSATPDTVAKLIKFGYDVVVERGAGEKASFPNAQYENSGAQIVDKAHAWAADIVLSLDFPATAELDLMTRGATLIARLAPRINPDNLQLLAERGLTGISMDMVPRISRAQSMDVLSSQANIAGYRAIIEAANNFGRQLTGQMTAAGKVPPATVYVIGVGVAGLAAIGTASSMGAIVNATDVRQEAAEQAESVGGNFIPIPAPAQESSDGYAKEMSAEQAKAAERLYAEQAALSDIVITTANIPGRKAPILLDATAVKAMKPGSVIVDLAAANGGNCELTVPGEVTVTDNGVTIVGYRDLAGRLPAQASQLFGQNIVNFFKLATPEKDGQLQLDLTDVIVEQMVTTLGGEIKFPPPPVQVSAAPAAKPVVADVPVATEEPKSGWRKYWWQALTAVLLAVLVWVSPSYIANHYFVFALAVVLGFYVISNVERALHTPLMSVTNAISGIIVVGTIIQMSHPEPLVKILAFTAIVFASVNVFGGFMVTQRMLDMFKRS